MRIPRLLLALLSGASIGFLPTQAGADQVILDDLIVQFSACVGSDCVDGEDFGFDTLRLKADDPAIYFLDTSSSAAFPPNDWSIGVTDNAGGGAADLVIRDVSAAVNVMVLQAGGGVALGAASTLEPNAISVGSIGNERRIMHVADGVDPSDAISLSQFEAATATIDSRIDAINARIDDLLNRIDQL